MNRPDGYTNYVAEGIEPGGHKCTIKQVFETTSKNGKPMLVIYFDTAREDKAPEHFGRLYAADQKAGKTGDKLKWRGVMYMVTVGEYANKNLAQLHTSVSASNDPELLTRMGWTPTEDTHDGKTVYEPRWGAGYAACFKDLKVGVVFRLEEYRADDMSIRASAKPFRFCSYDKALEQAIPKRKEADPLVTPQMQFYGNDYQRDMTPDVFKTQAQAEPVQQSLDTLNAMNEGFMHIPDNAGAGLPFN